MREDAKLKNFKEDEFTFGKYKGELIDNVNDKQYLQWVLDELDPEHDISQEFAKNIEMHYMEL